MGYAITVLVILWTVAGWAFNRTVELLRIRMAIIERENIHLAGGVVKAQKDAEVKIAAANSANLLTFEKMTGVIAENEATIEGLNQRVLTLENKQPKIAPRPTRVNFRQFRAAMEASTEPEEADNG